jgi:DNA-binding SARP family transcriptional activator/tetratricopeptide (TPR) repeat protein
VSTLEVRLLGGLDVRVEGEPLPPIPRAGRALLAHLLLHRRRPVSRDAAAALFWPDLDPSRARRRLSHTLWQVQDAIGEHPAAAGWLVADVDRLQLDAGRAWIDIEEFERRLERLRPSVGTVPDWRRADRADLADAVDLYRGDLLPDVHETWVLPERERLGQLHLEALGWLVAMGKSQGDFEDALLYARRITHLEPLREDAHREVMRLCTLLGRPGDALRQYERVESVLAEELGTSPARETVQLRAFVDRQRQAPTEPRATEEVAPVVRLVGRDRERQVGVAALERALGSDASVVLVEGEPGIGKTRLVQELTDAARWRGFTVLQGAATPTGGRSPFGPVVGPLERELTPVRVEQLRPHVEPVWLPTAAALLPVLDRLRPAEPAVRLGGRDHADRLREALARIVLGLAAVDPVLLVLEDLHDADPETLAVVERLVRSLDHQRLALVITYRSAEARQRDEVWRTLRLVDEAAAPDRIDLAPLATFGVAELARAWLGSAPPAGLSHQLARETGGNPLFALETLVSLRQGGHLDRPDGHDFPIAGTLREAVTSRIAELDPATRDVLEAAALQPGGTDIHLLIDVLSGRQSGGEVAHHAAALVGRGLLVESQDGLVFRHEVLRRTVEDDIPPEAARRLHRAIAAALEDRGAGRPADLAAHLEAAGEDRAAGTAHHAAGRQAVTMHAYATAAVHLRRARDLAVGPSGLERRRALLTELESVLDVLGERDEQAAVLAELDRLVAPGSPGTADVGWRRARLAWATDDLEGAVAAARRVLDDETADVGLRQEVSTVLGRALQASGRLEEAAEVLRAELPAGPEADGAPTLAALHLALGSVLSARADYDAAEVHLTAAVELAEVHRDVRTIADARTALGLLRAERGDRAGALPAYGEALARCRDLGYRYGEAVALVNLANASWDRPAEALSHLTEAATVFRELGNERGAAIALVNRACVRHLDLGDDAGAASDGAEATAFFRRIGDDGTAAVAVAIEATVAAARGDGRRAISLIEDAAAPPSLWARMELTTAAGRVRLAAGDPAAAVAAARESERLALESGTLAQLVPSVEVLVEGLLAIGEVDEAVAATDRVMEAVASVEVERPHRLWWARHRALGAAGRDGEAAAALTRAVAAVEALLDDLPATLRPGAEQVPVHRSILAAETVSDAAGLRLWLAAADAPTGRPLTDEEVVEVIVTLPERGADEPEADHRQRAIVVLVRAASAAGAICTVEDLAEVLAVSVSTVRRDLGRLRTEGHELPTRGRRAG